MRWVKSIVTVPKRERKSEPTPATPVTSKATARRRIASRTTGAPILVVILIADRLAPSATQIAKPTNRARSPILATLGQVNHRRSLDKTAPPWI
jgi:hypothetical protein